MEAIDLEVPLDTCWMPDKVRSLLSGFQVMAEEADD